MNHAIHIHTLTHTSNKYIQQYSLFYTRKGTNYNHHRHPQAYYFLVVVVVAVVVAAAEQLAAFSTTLVVQVVVAQSVPTKEEYYTHLALQHYELNIYKYVGLSKCPSWIRTKSKLIR